MKSSGSSNKSNFLGILVFILALGIISLSSFGCAKAQDKPKASAKIDKNVMATVGSDVITTEDFESEIQNLPPAYQAIAKQNKKEFLNSLVNKKLLLNDAKKKNLENSAEVKKFLEKAKEELMVQQLLKSNILDKIKVSPEDAKAFYDANPDQFKEPEKYKASHILLKNEADAEVVLKDLKSGADFAKLAKEKSEDLGSKDRGGDIGYFSKGDLVPEFEEVVTKMKIGDISNVVKSPLGFHIIKLTDKKEAAKKDFKDVEKEITNRLLVEKQMKAYDGMIESLKKQENVTINTSLLEEKKETPEAMMPPVAEPIIETPSEVAPMPAPKVEAPKVALPEVAPVKK